MTKLEQDFIKIPMEMHQKKEVEQEEKVTCIVSEAEALREQAAN